MKLVEVYYIRSVVYGINLYALHRKFLRNFISDKLQMFVHKINVIFGIFDCVFEFFIYVRPKVHKRKESISLPYALSKLAHYVT